MINDLPRVYNPSYTQARKSGKGYRLYWRGTRNEIFPDEIFRSPSEAQQYLHAMILKQNEKNKNVQSAIQN